MKIAVLGSGGWGTALAMLLVENGHEVTLWSYLEKESRQLQETGENPLLPGVKLPQGLNYTWDLSCVQGCGVVVLATPSFGVRATAEQIRDLLDPAAILVSVSKGIEKGTSLRMTQIIRQATEDRYPVVALSGPSHAEEVARRVYNVFEDVLPERRAGVIAEIKGELLNHGALGAAMSGTGPTVFGLFREQEQARQACRALSESFRDVWTAVPVGRE